MNTLPDAILINNYQPIALIKITYSNTNTQLLQHNTKPQLPYPAMLITTNTTPTLHSQKTLQLLKKHTHISAIATIIQVSALDTFLQLYTTIHNNNQHNISKELISTLETIQQLLIEKYPTYKKYNPQKHNPKQLIKQLPPNANLILTTLHTCINPYASTPWPSSLIGTYDTTYLWQPSNNAFLPSNNPTTTILKRYAAHLLAGSISIPIKITYPSNNNNNNTINIR